MGEILNIYNTDIEIPDIPTDVSEIEDWGTNDPQEQFFRRKKLPPIFKNLNYDSSGNITLTPEQEAFCKKDLEKIRNGCWVMINGKPTWLPYNYYYYLQHWTLENKKAPEYREVSRRYAIYRWHWRRVYWCLGILRGKGRRTGATSEITSNIVCEATTNKNRRAGVISKSLRDSRKIFLYRVQFGFRHLVFYLQPTLENEKDSKTELVFNVPINRDKKKNKVANLIDEIEGINSIIDYQAPGLNAYDQERLTDLLMDEGGKLDPDVPFSELLSIISECLVEGGEKVGFAEMPSTVNKWNKGGEQFKIAWDGATWTKDADADEVDEDLEKNNEETANRFVRYYCAAYDGLPGFIGKFGESIIEQPTPEQKDFLISKYGEQKYNGIYKYGAKEYLLRRRRKLKGAALEEEIRKYSFDEIEMFMSANADCIFNTVNITNRKRLLSENPVYKRKIVFWRDMDTQKVKWRDIIEHEKNFHWEITWFPPNGEDNKCKLSGGTRLPGRTDDGAITVDSYSNSQGGRKYGSKACALIGRKSDLLDPENTGKPIGMLYGRPAEKDKLHDQVLLAAEFFGYQVWYEHTADDYDGYFKDRGRVGYLGKYPKSMIDPTKIEKQERHRGTPITPFSLTKQLDNGISFFENHCDKIDWIEILDNALIFDPNDRTKFDILVSFLILISVLMERPLLPPKRKYPLVQTYENENWKRPIYN